MGFLELGTLCQVRIHIAEWNRKITFYYLYKLVSEINANFKTK